MQDQIQRVMDLRKKDLKTEQTKNAFVSVLLTFCLHLHFHNIIV